MSIFDEFSDDKLVVEIGWEVCWQLGGIYTVLRSKAPVMTKKLGNKYCMLGPYNAKTAHIEFEELEPTGPFGEAVKHLQMRGIKAHYGRWLITGRPQVVLIDFLGSWEKLSSFCYYMWKDHYISVPDESELNDVVLFGFLASDFLQILCHLLQENRDNNKEYSGLQLPVLAHVHEWMAGIPLLEIKKRRLPVVSVFTTHATLLGRYLASMDTNFYNNLPTIEPWKAAEYLNIKARFSIERSAALCATVFSTISDITSYEAEHFLGRKADVLLPNALNIQRFAAVHEFQNMHVQYKKQINRFIMGHFFPSYSFDLNKTVYVFTSGRYEYNNKGMDLFLESLARLNWRLKCSKSQITVVAFIITKAPNKGVNVDVLKNQMLLTELHNLTTKMSDDISEKLLYNTVQGKIPTVEDLIDDYSQLRLKRLMHTWKKGAYPVVVTHNMLDDKKDPILQKIRECNLINSPQDPVKVVFHPEFLSSTSPLIGLDYDQFVRGCHLGVFASYYEPWGYTPMECAALGIPSITSDLAGFGTYCRSNIPDHKQRGLFIVDRRYRSYDDSVNQLTDYMQYILCQERRERIDLRNKVEATSVMFDWKELIKHYWTAHRMAFLRGI